MCQTNPARLPSSLPAAGEYEGLVIAEAMGGHDGQEGIAAFAEKRRPDLGDLTLGQRPRCHIVTSGLCGKGRRGKGVAIYLAVGRQGQRVHDGDPRRHHVVREHRPQSGLHLGLGHVATRGRHEGFDPGLRAVPGPQDRRRQLLDLDFGEPGIAVGLEEALAEEAAGKMPDGAVIIAAITSCTNTSNPRNVIAAGLLARNAKSARKAMREHLENAMADLSEMSLD